MTLYKINIHTKDYTKWDIYNATNMETADINIDPIEHKLLTNDVFTFENENVNIIHSSVRMNYNIPAVLIIEGGKTYGREVKRSGKNTNARLMYKCIPDDLRLPVFTVPYDIKEMNFSKVFKNRYVTIKFTSWEKKHPQATISQNFGPVDILDNFYEYQLYCKSLNASIQKFNKDTNDAIKGNDHDSFITRICEKYTEIEDRTNWKTFTIDPSTSLDYDDGFSIKTIDNNHTMISIYIANVTIWMDSLNLWDSFSKRISTIYLPDRKRPMLPTILSDCLCSLQQKMRRFALACDITIDQNGTITSINYTNTLIRVFKNYAYEEPLLLKDTDYIHILQVTKQLSQKYKYIPNVRNSHDIVCYLMIFMNFHSAKKLLASHNGIFRSTIVKEHASLPETLPEHVSKFIKIWNSTYAQYVDIQNIPKDQIYNSSLHTRHDVLEMDAYIHITSPIRRLVDLLNIIKLQENLSLIKLSSNAKLFYNKWVSEIEYINTTMRSIRKVQTDSSMLHLCFNDPSILERTFKGYCFDKISRGDGLFQYMVYLPDIQLTSRITIRDSLENFQEGNFKLYIFNNEEKFKKKIRIQYLDNYKL